MAVNIKFGTDGWRGIIADDFTFANVRLCAQSAAQHLKKSGLAERGLVIGYDTRFASQAFAHCAAEVIAANGIKVYLSNRPAPTPALSYSILDLNAGGAVVITASHNPAAWNGFKYKPEYGGSASPEVVAELEQAIPQIERGGPIQRLPLDQAKQKSLLEYTDPQPGYLRKMAQLADVERIHHAGLRVVIDSMYGAAAGWLRKALSGDGSKIWEIRRDINPAFPGMHNPEPIMRNLQPLARSVRRHGADIGLATDGDGDRIGVIAEDGSFINQLQVFALLAYYLLEVMGKRGPIVKSVTTTRMVNRLGELYGVPVYEMPVGFKFIGPKMMEVNALIGGEESGGFGFRDHVPERDGILSALYFLDLLSRTRKHPTQLIRELYAKVGPHYYDRIDFPLSEQTKKTVAEMVAESKPERLAGLKVVAKDDTDGHKFTMEDGSWLLIRFSGTEPLLRIYVEVTEQSLLPKLLAAGKELASLK